MSPYYCGYLLNCAVIGWGVSNAFGNLSLISYLAQREVDLHPSFHHFGNAVDAASIFLLEVIQPELLDERPRQQVVEVIELLHPLLGDTSK